MGVWAIPSGEQAAIAFRRPWSVPIGSAVAIPFAPDVPVPTAGNDAYTTAYRALLTIAAPGFIANDTLNGGTVALGAGVSNGTLTFNPDGSFIYQPTSHFHGDDSFTYTITNASGTATATVTITVEPLPPTQRYALRAARLPWSTPARVMRGVGSGWSLSAQVRRSNGLPWDHAAARQRSSSAPWIKTPRQRAIASLPWGQAPQVRGSAPSLPWRKPPREGSAAGLPWGGQPRRRTHAGLPWGTPLEHQITASLPWSRPPPRGLSAGVPWRRPPKRERRWLIPWRYAPAVQWHVRSPGTQPPGDGEPPPPWDVPPGNRVAVRFACAWHVADGNAAAIPFSPAACYFAWPQPRVYIVENSAAVVRLPERTPISVTSIDLSQTADDVHWGMRMSLGDPADLELLKADVDGPKLVEITINGYVWTAIVEGYSQDRKHPTRLVDVSGRSQTALLDAPYAPLRSKVEDDDRQAQQLVDEELEGTGFTADYGTVTWLVPAGAWHYESQAAIAAVKTIAAASGAVALAHPWDKVITIAPRYAASPWSWSTTGADKFIQDDIIGSDSLRLVSKPLYDYVLVSGDQVGVADPIIRDGSAGTVRAQMIVDALVTDHAVSFERGRNVLSDRGDQAQVDLTIPLFPIDVPGQPGLVLPLELVEVVELVSWKALALGVAISARMQASQDGRAVLVVEQTVTLERHYSDAG